MKIQASAEDYLETILVIEKKQGKVRSVDIANHMGFAKPTISIKMKQFRDNGYITFDAERNIHLTEKGAEIASRIHERHKLLVKILTAIGVDENQALEDACKIEHNISEETFNCIKNFYEKNFK
ncbi:MAG: metal-dependent transcriptional regulator [Clostridiales bacterium]|jgi:Mn-dependent DtxR family transcriptional regulator|nr:metal-dependent transcriptional regulator [Clostridiales bacterium]